MALDMTFAPCKGVYKSRTTARALVITAPMAAPCNTRHATKTSMLGLSTQPTAATVYATKPVSMMGRRPTLSENGPQNSCETPNANSKPLRVYCTMPTLACKSSAMPGKPGKYKSVETGCKPIDKDNNKITKLGCINVLLKTNCPNRACPVVAK